MSTQHAPTPKFNLANVLNRRVAAGLAIAVGTIGLTACGGKEPGVYNDNIPEGFVPNQPYLNEDRAQLDFQRISGTSQVPEDACGELVAKSVGDDTDTVTAKTFLTIRPNGISCISEGGDPQSMLAQNQKFADKVVFRGNYFDEEPSDIVESAAPTTEAAPASTVPVVPPASTYMPENGIPGTQKPLPN